MGYVAVKALTLCGNKYLPGEHILEEHLLPTRIRRLLDNNCIARVNAQEAAASSGILETEGDKRQIVIPIAQEPSTDGEAAEVFSVPLTEGDIQEVFSIMQMTVEEASKAIEKIDNENMLIVLHGADSRQGVKKAAKKQAERLNETEAAGQPEG